MFLPENRLRCFHRRDTSVKVQPTSTHHRGSELPTQLLPPGWERRHLSYSEAVSARRRQKSWRRNPEKARVQSSHGRLVVGRTRRRPRLHGNKRDGNISTGSVAERRQNLSKVMLSSCRPLGVVGGASDSTLTLS